MFATPLVEARRHRRGHRRASGPSWDEALEPRTIRSSARISSTSRRLPPGVAAGLLTLGELALEKGPTDEARRLLVEAKEAADASGTTAFAGRIDAALTAAAGS
jgi:hypothetical protein